jgi:hypothetical protein
MSSSKNIELQRDFSAGVDLSEAQNPIPSPLTHCIRADSVGKGEGGELNQRDRERRGATVHKAGPNIPT